MFSFVHTADLHIGTPFKTSVRNQKIREMLINSTYDAFNNLVELCLENDVDFLIIAGDIFDSESVELRAHFSLKHRPWQP